MRLTVVAKFLRSRLPIPLLISFGIGFIIHILLFGKYFFHQSMAAGEMTLGAFSFILFIIVMRVADDLKDFQSDRIDFPDRPTQTGLVNEADLKWFLKVLLLAVPFINLMIWIYFDKPNVFYFSVAVTVYSYLLYRWFFLEKYIRPRLWLALLTHNPIVYLYQFYILSFFENSLQKNAVMYMVADAMITTAWEVSRKIRGTTEETSYGTYSKMWGIKGSTLVFLLLLLASLAILVHTFQTLFSPLIWIIPGIFWFILFIRAFLFWKDSEKAPSFRILVEVYRLLIVVVYMILLIG